MRINNLSLNHFNMKANSFSYQPLNIARAVFQPDRSIYPILGELNLKPKKMTMIAEFKSKLDISNFIAELLNHKVNIFDIDDGFIYKIYLQEVNNSVTEYWQGWYRLSLPVLVIQCGHEQKYTLAEEKNLIVNIGNYKCDCIYTILPLRNLESLTVDQITIKNLIAGNQIVLNGELKKVYSETEPNKYSDCTFGNNLFPKLDPGLNTIFISNPTDVKINLSFTPIFI